MEFYKHLHGEGPVREVFMVRTEVKMDNLDVWPLSVENEALLTCNFTSN